MKKIRICFLVALMLCSCAPRKFKSPAELIHRAKENQKKEERLKEDWKAIAIFSFFVLGIYQLKKGN